MHTSPDACEDKDEGENIHPSIWNKFNLFLFLWRALVLLWLTQARFGDWITQEALFSVFSLGCIEEGRLLKGGGVTASPRGFPGRAALLPGCGRAAG